MKRIASALISVYDKQGVDELIRSLAESGVALYSTGGTLRYIEELGYTATPVEELTGYPSILGGRVKTLHPKVFGGILARREQEEDRSQLARYALPTIDLVVVDLYPFARTVEDDAPKEEVIEKIDIGGIALIRAAAKNFSDVAVAASKAQYAELLELLRTQQGQTTLEQRRHLAAEAFAVSSAYDAAIFNYFNRTEQVAALRLACDGCRTLRYGENPHQQARWWGTMENLFTQRHGKELSYNNLLDLDAALALVADFPADRPLFAILKHNNACGAAVRPTLAEAYSAALACDPVSAYGGVLVCNRPMDAETAALVADLFSEVVAAPGFEPEALERLRNKRNRILLELHRPALAPVLYRSLLGGLAEQQRDERVGGVDGEVRSVTPRAATEAERRDMLFANRIVKHSRSNAIVLARGEQLLASGVGQTSRVDALRQAIAKAEAFGFDLQGAVMASDAFFPFADCVQIAYRAGIRAVIQPGGSVRDDESIAFCRDHDMTMLLTGLRHFRH